VIVAAIVVIVLRIEQVIFPKNVVIMKDAVLISYTFFVVINF
jgi:hypothetical protein